MELKRLFALEDALIAQLLESYAIGAVPRKAVKDELATVQLKIKSLWK
jgi:hypothetical protein